MTQLLTIATLSFCLFVSKAYAEVQHTFSLTSTVDRNILSVDIQDIIFPENLLQKELNSGLPNHLSVLLHLTDNQNMSRHFELKFSITYDLWDENYQLFVSRSDGQKESFIEFSFQSLTRRLGSIKISQPFDISSLSLNKTYYLFGQIIINPIKKERIKRIQKWISQSNGFTFSESNDSESNDSESNNTESNNADSNNTESGDAESHNRSSHEVAVTAAYNTANDIAITSVQNSNLADSKSNSVNLSRPRFKKLFEQILEQSGDNHSPAALWKSSIETVTFRVNEINE